MWDGKIPIPAHPVNPALATMSDKLDPAIGRESTQFQTHKQTAVFPSKNTVLPADSVQ